MESAPELVRLFTRRADSYARFIRVVLYAQGIRAYFLQSPHLRSGLRVLDAGCGTGVVTFALREALLHRGLYPATLHAFDLTPAMLDRFGRTLREKAIAGVETTQANVLALDQLPESWSNYDLVVAASMLEYVPRDRLSAALAGLRQRLTPGGRLVLFVTRRNWLTRPLIGRWWKGNLYSAPEVRTALQAAGVESTEFGRFPPAFRHLNLWGHIVEARHGAFASS
jgi:ubiquinone/menaquinone biosynthesis C-methylase UbiE